MGKSKTLDEFWCKAKNAARSADGSVAGQIDRGAEQVPNANRNQEVNVLRTALIDGATSDPTGVSDAAYFQSLRAVAGRIQSGGSGKSSDQISDHREAVSPAQSTAAELIDRINADNVHAEISFGSPVGKEKF